MAKIPFKKTDLYSSFFVFLLKNGLEVAKIPFKMTDLYPSCSFLFAYWAFPKLFQSGDGTQAIFDWLILFFKNEDFIHYYDVHSL